jgi:uncharacterized protein (TIGR02646 family)
MERIAKNKMKIEHWRPQSIYHDLQLDYQNLLGACLGNQGQPQHLQHCDTRKGESEITINPTDARRKCENLIKYRGNGQIYSDDLTIDRELNEVLNLNLETLTKNRKAVLDGVILGLQKKYPFKSWTAAILSKELARYSKVNEKSQDEPYCQVIIFWLNKRLSAESKQK